MMGLQNVSKQYGGRPVLQNVSLTLEERGILLITGSNGSGKTTLLRLLAGLEKPDSGSVLLPAGCRVGYVFQDYRLVPTLTVRQNLELVLPRARRMQVQAQLRAVGLTQQEDSFPETLSGGMQQRAALARAFAFDGDLLLLDEPFSALDEVWKQRMMETVLDISQRRPVAVVTHSAQEQAFLGGRIFCLD